MKHLFLMVAIAATTVFLSSCNDEDSTNFGSENQVAVLDISTNITAMANNSTLRSGTISTIPNGAQMGLFIFGDANMNSDYDLSTNYKNVKSVFSGGKWVQSPNVFLTNKDGYVFAYYPYNSANTTAKAIPVEHTTQTDYLFGTQTGSAINNSNPSASIQLKHALALIQFKFNKQNYVGTGKLTKVHITNIGTGKALIGKGTIDIATGAISKSSDVADASIENTSTGLLASIPTSASTDESTYPKVMVIPVSSVTQTDAIKVDFTIDSKVYSWNVPVNTKWETGTKYTYEVTLKGTELIVSNVSIKDWDNGGNDSITIN